MTTKKKNQKVSSGKASSGKKKAPIVKKREHGALLTIALIVMGVHGLVAAYLYYALSTAPEVQRPWVLGMMVLHFLMNVAAAVGIYYWKKWGLYVYVISTVIALVAGLISIGVWSVFYMVLPLVIVGWLLRTKWDYFDA
jgi:hypothetical protein